jgi:hypothetical protein
MKRLLAQKKLSVEKVSDECHQLGVIWGGDGITPNKAPILGVGLRLIDEDKKILKNGVSNIVPVVVTWSSEAFAYDLAPLVNGMLGDFCSRIFNFDTGLRFRFKLKHTFGDGKFDFLTMGLKGGKDHCRCPLCKESVDNWGLGLDVAASEHGRDYDTGERLLELPVRSRNTATSLS